MTIPLLAFGWWLADQEITIPNNYEVICEELSENIVCGSFATKQRQAHNPTYRDDTVSLLGAKLQYGFHHPIVALEYAQVEALISDSSANPPAGAGKTKFLSLPPKPKGHPSWAHCYITPHSENINVWSYSCSGASIEPEHFYFENKKTSDKFRAALNTIRELSHKNQATEVKAFFSSLLTPIASYLFLSLAIFILSKIATYVVHGRKISQDNNNSNPSQKT